MPQNNFNFEKKISENQITAQNTYQAQLENIKEERTHKKNEKDKKIDILEKTIAEIQSKIESIENNSNSQNEELIIKQQEIHKAYVDLNDDFDELGNICQNFMQDLLEKENKINELSELIKRQKNEITELTTTNLKLKDHSNDLNNKIQTIENNLKNLTNTEIKYNQINNIQKSLKKEQKITKDDICSNTNLKKTEDPCNDSKNKAQNNENDQEKLSDTKYKIKTKTSFTKSKSLSDLKIHSNMNFDFKIKKKSTNTKINQLYNFRNNVLTSKNKSELNSACKDLNFDLKKFIPDNNNCNNLLEKDHKINPNIQNEV